MVVFVRCRSIPHLHSYALTGFQMESLRGMLYEANWRLPALCPAGLLLREFLECRYFIADRVGRRRRAQQGHAVDKYRV